MKKLWASSSLVLCAQRNKALRLLFAVSLLSVNVRRRAPGMRYGTSKIECYPPMRGTVYYGIVTLNLSTFSNYAQAQRQPNLNFEIKLTRGILSC